MCVKEEGALGAKKLGRKTAQGGLQEGNMEQVQASRDPAVACTT